MEALLVVLAAITLNGASSLSLNGKVISGGISILDIGSLIQQQPMERITFTEGHISVIEMNGATANVSHISFIGCSIGTIKRDAFKEIVNLHSISFIDSTIGEIKPFAFSGATVQALIMESCSIDVMYNFAFERLEVRLFKVSKCDVTGCMGTSTFSAMSSALGDVQITGNNFLVPPSLNENKREVGKEYNLKCTNGWSVKESQVWIYFFRHTIYALSISSFLVVLLTIFVSRKVCVGQWGSRTPLGIPKSSLNVQVCEVKEYRRIPIVKESEAPPLYDDVIKIDNETPPPDYDRTIA